MSSNQRTSGGLVRTGVQLSEDQVRELELLARERQTSLSSIVRDAIRLYLATNRASAAPTPVLS